MRIFSKNILLMKYQTYAVSTKNIYFLLCLLLLQRNPHQTSAIVGFLISSCLLSLQSYTLSSKQCINMSKQTSMPYSIIVISVVMNNTTLFIIVTMLNNLQIFPVFLPNIIIRAFLTKERFINEDTNLVTGSPLLLKNLNLVVSYVIT